MPKTSVLILAFASMAIPTLTLAAAPAATPQEADRLRAVFERYLGHAEPGDTPVVTVTPEGTSYRASFDVKQMMRPLQAFGVTMDAAMQTLVLAPNDNGTWHVASDAMPPLVMRMNDQTVEIKASTSAYEGTFDPALGLFLDQTSTDDGITLDQEAPALSQHRRSGHAVLTQKAAPVDGEHATVDARYALSDVTAQMTMHAPPASADAPPASPPMAMSYTVPTGTLDLHIDRLHARGLLDLWAFFVAHPTRDAITASQDDLRALLKAALPILSGLREAVTFGGLSVQSPLGEVKAGTLTTSLDVADLSGTGKIVSALSVDGLAVPSQSLPPWSTGFLPTSIDLRPSVTGLHIDEAARQAANAFDLKHDGLTPEQSRQIGHTLWPGDGKVTLALSHIATPLLGLTLEGEASIGDLPAGHLTVTAAGLDKAIAALQAVADTDPTAGQVLSQLVAAKNLGKPSPDGSFVWLIEAVAGGAVSVNGVPLK